MLIFTGDICLCDKAFDIGFGVGSQISKGKVLPFNFLNKQEDDKQHCHVPSHGCLQYPNSQ